MSKEIYTCGESHTYLLTYFALLPVLRSVKNVKRDLYTKEESYKRALHTC